MNIQEVIDMKNVLDFFVLCFLFVSCKSNPSDKFDKMEPTSIGAEYVLPYPVGQAYTCSLGFNMPISHVGTFRYAVDFEMPIGTVVTAVRGGRVVYIIQNYSDTDRTKGHENVVIIMHDDSTYARYVHLTFTGALVKMDQIVKPGDPVGLSGSSGTIFPHLHFDVTETFTGRSDQTIPFDFKNIAPYPLGLERGVAYEALPY